MYAGGIPISALQAKSGAGAADDTPAGLPLSVQGRSKYGCDVRWCSSLEEVSRDGA
jgi:hypothetical protein